MPRRCDIERGLTAVAHLACLDDISRMVSPYSGGSSELVDDLVVGAAEHRFRLLDVADNCSRQGAMTRCASATICAGCASAAAIVSAAFRSAPSSSARPINRA